MMRCPGRIPDFDWFHDFEKLDFTSASQAFRYPPNCTIVEDAGIPLSILHTLHTFHFNP